MKAMQVSAVVIWAASLATSAAGAPCAGSAYPPAGFDGFPSSAIVGVDSDPGCGAPTLLHLTGDTTIKRGDPFDPGDGRCTIDTEMISLNLTSDAPVLVVEASGGSNPGDAGDPPCSIGGAFLDGGPGCSPGQVRAQTAGTDFPADSFFDVFVEITIGGQTIFNRNPIAVQSVISSLPPLGGIFANPGTCVPLYAAADPFGAPVLYLASVQHKVGCGNGVIDPGEDCDGGACCTSDCTFASTSTVCRSAGDQCDAEETCDGLSADCPADLSQPDGTPCVDADLCTGPDTCQSGTCTSGPVLGDGTPCDDGNACTDPDTCQSGTCTGGPAVPDGSPCDDHHGCTGPDTCTAGVCSGPDIPSCLGPGDPFGDDDPGFVPPTKTILKCEDGLTKNVSKLTVALVKCNVKDSDASLKGKLFDSAACQATARGRYDDGVNKLTGCPACVDRNGLRDLTTTLVNQNGNFVFCDSASGALEDPPGTGFVPPDKTVRKCEDGVAKNATNLTLRVLKCHLKNADTLFKEHPFDEEACEVAADTKYDTGTTKLASCPACLDGAGQAALRDLVGALLDANNGAAYCASPSGAFVN